MSSGFFIEPVRAGAALDEARALFLRYSRSIGVDLCFQGFDAELAGLPGDYAPPAGRLLVARDAEGRAVGCAALRPLGEDVCEMKRLFVGEEARGLGLGRALAEALVADARRIGYRRMRLDTLPTMSEAASLYERLGFRDIAPYYDNPVPGARFLELELRP